MHDIKPYFQHVSARFAATALLGVLLVAPLITSAQVGYGGGVPTGGGGIYIPPGGGAEGGQVLGAVAFNFTQLLELGDAGDDVTELQKILISSGFLDIPEPTGFFGPLTEEALKAYQSANGLEAVGYVGPKTRALLNKGVAPAATVKATGTGNNGSTLTQEQIDLMIKDLKAKLEILIAAQDLLKKAQ